MNMKKIFCLVLSGALMCGLCACGNQDNSNSSTSQNSEIATVAYHTPEAIKSRGEIKVGVMSGSFDYFKDKEGNNAGYNVELTNTIAKEIGENVKVTFVENELDPMLDQLANGEIDIAISSVEATPKNKQRFTLSASYWPFDDMKPFSLHILKSNSEKYKSLSDFSTAKIGIFDKQLKQLIPSYLPAATLTECDDEKACAEKLKSGEIDAILTDTPQKEADQVKFGDEITLSSVTIPENAEDMGLFIAMMKDNNELKEAIDKTISTHKENGDIKNWINNAYKELLKLYSSMQEENQAAQTGENKDAAAEPAKQEETTDQNNNANADKKE